MPANGGKREVAACRLMTAKGKGKREERKRVADAMVVNGGDCVMVKSFQVEGNPQLFVILHRPAFCTACAELRRSVAHDKSRH